MAYLYASGSYTFRVYVQWILYMRIAYIHTDKLNVPYPYTRCSPLIDYEKRKNYNEKRIGFLLQPIFEDFWILIMSWKVYEFVPINFYFIFEKKKQLVKLLYSNQKLNEMYRTQFSFSNFFNFLEKPYISQKIN